MVPHWFVYFMYSLIVVTCSLPCLEELAGIAAWLSRDRKFPLWEIVERTFGVYEFFSFAFLFGFAVLCLEFHRHIAARLFFCAGCAFLGVRLIALLYKSLNGFFKWMMVGIIFSLSIIGANYLLGIADDAQHEYEEDQVDKGNVAMREKIDSFRRLTAKQPTTTLMPRHPRSRPSSIPPPPPATELVIATGDDSAPLLFTGGNTWFDQEHHCKLPIKCYPAWDTGSNPAELRLPDDKAWARMLLLIYNIGGSQITHPDISVVVSRGTDVSLSYEGQHVVGNTTLEFQPNATRDILPFDISKSPNSYTVEVNVGLPTDSFDISVRIFGDNMKAKLVKAKIKVVSN